MAQNNRRDFLKTASVASLGAILAPHTIARPRLTRSANDRLVLGGIGVGDRWGSMRGSKDKPRGVGGHAMKFGDYVAVCDVDADRKERAKKLTGGKAEMFEDYRHVLDNKSIDVVTIVTTDHWHSKIAIAALKAGKDVYCEKPLTLTIEEGKQICEAVKETGRVFQVGTQQRSEYRSMFLKFVAIAKSGRLGKLKRVTCAIGGAPTSGPLPVVDVPKHLNWDMWLGQAPDVQYRQSGNKSRCHYEFRWWYEYSGGKMTDWGAHHVDIAQWAIGMDKSGPVSVEPFMDEVIHPVEYKDGWPVKEDQYNSATKFKIRCEFPNGVELFIRDSAQDLGFGNGILLEGENGKLFVSRQKLEGDAVDDLKENPLENDALIKLYKDKEPGNHMGNFVACIEDRTQPISDVFTHHRAMTTCHLANVAIRLGRPLKWDPVKEAIVGDKEANAWQTREQRKGYEIV